MEAALIGGGPRGRRGGRELGQLWFVGERDEVKYLPYRVGMKVYTEQRSLRRGPGGLHGDGGVPRGNLQTF